MPDQQAQREGATAARAEDRRGTGVERIQERRRIIGLLLRRGRPPAGRDGTTPVAAPVIGDNRELVGQQVGEFVEMAAVSCRSHDQQQGWPRSPDLVVQLGPVDGHSRHLRSMIVPAPAPSEPPLAA